MLTQAQIKTLEFIAKFIEKCGHAPTTQEIAAGIGIQSRGVVHRYLKALEAEGMIELEPKRHRNIKLLSTPPHHPATLPLVGSIAAGRPIEAIEHNESVNLFDMFAGEKRFALRVKGDSMVEEGIFDGDIVICQQTQHASNGQIVVALIDQQEATLKRIQYNKDHTITLIPANSNHRPMIYHAHQVQIQGIYVGLLRLS